MKKISFIASLFLLGISATAFAKSNETVKIENKISIAKPIAQGIETVDQSGGGSNSGTVLIPIKPPKPPVIIK
ncbi:hypothetical protein [Paenimyroides aestuarii]|uniref:Uncharacterized protein n=1 Tax=Paenimyroides aestuarii TaxID=2968490 RepID=A0ABY5NP12_9FLAO|nr:hypothetical protein [Paenimyroides aestuarii]UUV20239.1 hypothetical protein NPX36_07630 [Paenimyroides aestuarii]